MSKITIYGKQYTEHELFLMINQPYCVISLVNDILKEIMNFTNLYTSLQFAKTSHYFYNFYKSNKYWQNKFNINNLPFLYEINENNLKYVEQYKIKYQFQPINHIGWKKLYKNTIMCMKTAARFVHYIERTNHFVNFELAYNMTKECLWFPENWFSSFNKLPDILYNVHNNKYKIIANDLHNMKTLCLQRQEFIIYLAKLFNLNKKFKNFDDYFIYDVDNEKHWTFNDLLKI